MSADPEAAALAVTESMFGEAADKGFELGENAAPVEASGEGAVAEAPQAAVEAPEVEEEDAPIDFSAFKPIQAEEDEEEEEEGEEYHAGVDRVLIDGEPVDVRDVTDEEEYVDPEVAALRKQLAAAQKQLDHEKKTRIASSKKQWVTRLGKQYPLADFENIEATSRRGFERAAQESHNRNAKLLAPHVEKLEKAWNDLKGSAKEEGRTEAERAWGKPSVGPGLGQIGAAQHDEELAAARASGNLEKVIGVLFKREDGR